MKKWWIVFIIPLLIQGVSCTRHRDITYLRGIGQSVSDSLIQTTYNIYKVQPFDVLYIRVMSALDPKAEEMFNQNMQSSALSGNMNNMGTFYFSGYPINELGFIKMPILGEIYVSGLTQKEIEEQVQQRVREYIPDAEVKVRLLSFKVTLLGEIGSGQHTILAERANLLEVLAMGGDIQKTGNKHNVLILRTTPQGMRSYRVDLTDKNIVSSPLFYVQPNDIIYVEPTKAASLRISLSELSLFISSITAVTSMYFLIRSISQ
ncbi:MAG TPA: polysaccharide biosynthesis/export family protein [Bacteroidales bacterium]|nr:polysaccharide biosynthesis/export family protein [Bacteroidales bacterium]HOK98738.1 polysaccharide biosynthesis/export family protein [Bacteroidales bacterium]HPO66206.1 polysaccharide biosynthesis/export family protein [Bacteroidales bacterium]